MAASVSGVANAAIARRRFAQKLAPALTAALLLAAPAVAPAAEGDCLSFIPAAEERYDLPPGVLEAIGEIESNHNPLALNIGGRAILPDSYEEAVPLLYRNGRARRDLNIGCMQIHSRWHLAAVNGRPERFLSPEVNVDYAGRLLRRLYDRSGSWSEAVGRYHTGPGYPGFRRYICAVDRQLREDGSDTRLNC